MKTYQELIAERLSQVHEWMPWDLVERLALNPRLLIVDVREPAEYDAMHIPGSINVPRGILESAAEWDYEETVPILAAAREQQVVVVCRSGNRSVLAADTLQQMGFKRVASLNSGVRGWKDFDQPLRDADEQDVDLDEADRYFTPRLYPEQLRRAA